MFCVHVCVFMCLRVGMSVCERLCLGFIGVCVSSCVQIDVDVSMCVCVCARVRVCLWKDSIDSEGKGIVI